MVIGFVCRRTGLLDQDLIKKVNKVVFRIFLPTLIFVNLYESDFLEILNWHIILFIAGATTIVFLLAFLIVPRFEKDNKKRGVMIQGMMRGNGVYIGIPVMQALTGDAYLGLMALALAVIIICYNTYSVIVLETFRHHKLSFGRIFKGIVTNPMIASAMVALIFVLFQVKLPSLVMKILSDMGACATPLALVMLGGSFAFTSLGEYKKQIFATVFVKLILTPAICLPIAISLGFSAPEIAVIFAILAAPTAVASFTVAQQMDGDATLASQIVVYSSVCSMVTIFLWIILLQSFQ